MRICKRSPIRTTQLSSSYRRFAAASIANAYCIAAIMTSAISFGDENSSFQAGIINGPVNTTFNLPPGKLREDPKV